MDRARALLLSDGAARKGARARPRAQAVTPAVEGVAASGGARDRTAALTPVSGPAEGVARRINPA
ncbi:MAG: hypothetical protein Kow0013_20030 [Pararhodobacter sp.]